MLRVVLSAAFACVIALPDAGLGAEDCYTTVSDDDAADDEVRDLVASGALTTRGIGSVSALSATVSVSAPDDAAGERATATIQRILPDISRGFDQVGLGFGSPTTVSIQLVDVAETITTAAWTSCDGTDCEMQFYRESWTGDQGYLSYVLAHEFAHVAQQLNFDGLFENETCWWTEGTAEWFANVVVPRRDDAQQYMAEFDQSSKSESLTDMSYEAVPFFFWAGNEFGMDYPFVLGAHGFDVLASASQVASILDPDTWHDFVETFLDGNLRYPDGRRAWSNPTLGPVVRPGYGGDMRLNGPTLSIPRLIAEFPPGRWELELKGDTPRTSFRDGEAGAWFRIHNTRDYRLGYTHVAECGELSQLLMTAIGLSSPGFSIIARTEGDDLESEEAECLEPCDQPIPVDHCMIGAWTALSTDAPDLYNFVLAGEEGRHEWVYQDMGDNYAVLRGDGTFVMSTTGAESEFEHEVDGDLFHMVALVLSDSRGRWSVTDDSHLVMCTDDYAGTMFWETTVGGETVTAGPEPVPNAEEYVGGDGNNYQYTCAGDTANITLMRWGFMPTISWNVERVAMPPPPGEPE